MASKQLEIIVNARDNASGVFRGVGDSAGKLGKDLGSVNSLAESGHGLHKSLRQLHNIILIGEVAKVAWEALGGVTEAVSGKMAGNFDQVASGGRKAFDALAEIPLIGKPIAAASEFIETKLSHLFGKQSTAEMEADAEKKKKVLEGFAEATKKIGEELGKRKNEAALVGLAPEDAAIEKAKQQYAKAIAELKPLKAALISAAGQISGEDAKAQSDKIKQIADDAAKVRDDEIAKANGKKELAEHEFSEKLVDITRERNQQLEALGQDLEAKQLNADNRAYEARLSGLKAALSKEIDAVQDAAHKQFEELEKQKAALQPLAHAGNEEAKNQIAALNEAQTKVFENSQEQQGKLADSAIVEQKAARDAAIREATLASLRTEADAGDAIAKVELTRLTTSREQEATERALAAILADAESTDQQRAAAQKQLVELKKSEGVVITQNLRDSQLAILEQQAALGDESAKMKVQQIQAAKEQADIEAQINAILRDRNSTEAQRAEARKQQQQIQQTRQQATGNEVRDAGLFVLQQEAALGDKIAERQLRKIELEKQFTDQKQHLLAVLNSEANAQDKLNAQKALSGLESVKQRALLQIGGREKLSSAATLEESRFLTGVSADAAQDRDQYQPIVDVGEKNLAIGEKHVSVSEKIAYLLEQYLKKEPPAKREIK